MKTSSQKTIFSGIQPSGNLHLGNYLGAIKQWVEMQNDYQCIFCVVDYHAITVPQDPKIMQEKIIEVAKIYLAAGIDPKKSIIFQQSAVKEHTELAWILNCTVARMSDLNNMTQFKDKVKISKTTLDFLKEYKETLEKIIKERKHLLTLYNQSKKLIDEKIEKLEESIKKEIPDYNKLEIEKIENELEDLQSIIEEKEKNINKIQEDSFKNIFDIIQEYRKTDNVGVGLFDYPVLMAADILLYDTDLVPIGEDQIQHVELARDLAKRFNNQFGETFKIPEYKVRQEGARIMGLDDPTKKMSKSAASENNYIALTDDPDKAAQKIMRATTDSGSGVKLDWANKPGISNLLTIYSLLTDKKISEIEAEFAGKGYGEFKGKLAEIVKNFLISFQKKYYNINDHAVLKILGKGGKQLQEKATIKISEIKKKIGVL